jgi:hypothetical protein
MSIKQMRKSYTLPEEVKDLENNVKDVLDQITGIGLLDGRLIQDVALLSGANRIAHVLGRKPQGFIIVNRNSSAIVWQTNIDTLFITLNASANITVSLWIF